MIDDSASRRKDGWRPEQDRMIIDLRNEHLPWKEIGQRAGRTVESCCSRYRVLVPAVDRVRVPSASRWLKEDEARLRLLLAEKKTPQEIAKEMGRPKSSVYSKIEYARRRSPRVHFEAIARRAVPPERLADRDRRMAAERDITSEFFGDPRPGQSALDQRDSGNQRLGNITLAGACA